MWTYVVGMWLIVLAIAPSAACIWWTEGGANWFQAVCALLSAAWPMVLGVVVWRRQKQILQDPQQLQNDT
jgi:hypothetical protein